MKQSFRAIFLKHSSIFAVPILNSLLYHIEIYFFRSGISNTIWISRKNNSEKEKLLHLVSKEANLVISKSHKLGIDLSKLRSQIILDFDLSQTPRALNYKNLVSLYWSLVIANSASAKTLSSVKELIPNNYPISEVNHLSRSSNESNSLFMRLNNYITFLKIMTEKEIKSRYKKALFGFLWILINPLLQMLVIGVIFSFFIKIPNYFIFLFAGLLPWQFFSLSISKSTPSIVYERALLFKAKFPIESIVLSIILSNFIQIIFSTILFVAIIPFFINIKFLGVLYVFLCLIWLLVITVALSLITASMNVKYRDVNFLVQTLLVLWFYATPILYNLNTIPENYKLLFAINPLTSIFEIIHYQLLGQGTIDKTILVSNLFITTCLMLIGVRLWKKESKYFVDWL